MTNAISRTTSQMSKRTPTTSASRSARAAAIACGANLRRSCAKPFYRPIVSNVSPGTWSCGLAWAQARNVVAIRLKRLRGAKRGSREVGPFSGDSRLPFSRRYSMTRMRILPSTKPFGCHAPENSGTSDDSGWETWIRTKINGVRVRCSTVELSPNETPPAVFWGVGFGFLAATALFRSPRSGALSSLRRRPCQLNFNTPLAEPSGVK